MTALLAAMLASATMALVFKINEGRDGNRYLVTTVNYLTAMLVSGLLLLRQGLPAWPGQVALEPLVSQALAGETLTVEGSVAWSLWLGLPAGLCLFLGLVFYQLAVRHAGVGPAGAFAKLGVLVPIALTTVLWAESLSAWQMLGGLVALVALCLVVSPRGGPGGGSGGGQWLLAALALTVGLADFSGKLFQVPALAEHKPLFLLAAFTSAFCCSLPTHLRRRPMGRRDGLLGVAVGVPNLLSSYFLIMALEALPATVVFPIFSAGTTVILLVVGRYGFGERLDGRRRLAMVLVVPALVLVHLGQG